MDYKHGVKKVVVSFEMEDGTIQVLAIQPDSSGLKYETYFGCRNLDGFVESTGEISLSLSVRGLMVDDSPVRPWTSSLPASASTPVYFMD